MWLQPFDKSVQGFFLMFDGFDQFKLGSAAVKIMGAPVDFIIRVTGKVVGKKTYSHDERDKFTGKNEMSFFSRPQEMFNGRPVSTGECFEIGLTQPYFRQVLLVFAGGACGSPNHIAEIKQS